jgi:broad specificity phosphatase PhoE
MRTFRHAALLPLLTLSAAFTVPERGTAPSDSTVVILVRHAEKASQTDKDPLLSAEGTARAAALARAVRDAGVEAVLVTPYQRTRLTAQGVLEAQHLTAEPIAVTADVAAHARSVASAIRDHHAGQVVLVVGHSNTIPAIIGALGGPVMPDLCDAAYANLFTLVIAPTGTPHLVRGQYGAADPPDAGACATMKPR